MSFSKEFYFKEGKLELSMLDDDYESEPEEKRNILEEDKSSESNLVVSEEVYKTLHYMGKYLTLKEEPSKCENNYESTITKEDEISCSKDKNIILFTKHEQENKLESGNKQNVCELEKAEDESEIKSLNQQSIDSILEGYFDKCSTQSYPYAEELKKHIDKQIEAIRNYN